MNVYITFDYEIYFGNKPGDYDKTLLNPTESILSIARKENAKFTFFIDCGYLLTLKKYGEKYPNLIQEYKLISEQIKKINSEGHDCQLHIHPHWEKTTYNGKDWKFDYNYYKLSDFPENEIQKIFKKYSTELESLTGKKVVSYRAGGWCIQPFSKIKPGFENQGIKIDSSVFSGGKDIEAPYFYDYTEAPNKDMWHFENDICKAEDNGRFIELPISSYRYSPLFFWRLFILGNLFPKLHKPIGNGKPMASRLTRKKMLTQKHFLSANVDGYFISKVQKIIKRNQSKNFKHTVIIGHPKAATHYSIHQMARLIQKNKNWCSFKSFSMFYDEISR